LMVVGSHLNALSMISAAKFSPRIRAIDF